MSIRRILLLPYNCHSYFLPILSETLPIYDEICKRSMKFIASSLESSSQLVKSIAKFASYCIMFGRNNSVLGTKMLCYVVIDITGRCQNLLVILSKLSIFHSIVGILITYLTLKRLLPVLCLNR